MVAESVMICTAFRNFNRGGGSQTVEENGGAFVEGIGVAGSNADLGFPGGRHVHLVAADADGTDSGNDALHAQSVLFKHQGVVCLGVGGNHDAFLFVGQGQEDFLSDEGHERMQ